MKWHPDAAARRGISAEDASGVFTRIRPASDLLARQFDGRPDGFRVLPISAGGTEGSAAPPSSSSASRGTTGRPSSEARAASQGAPRQTGASTTATRSARRPGPVFRFVTAFFSSLAVSPAIGVAWLVVSIVVKRVLGLVFPDDASSLLVGGVLVLAFLAIRSLRQLARDPWSAIGAYVGLALIVWAAISSFIPLIAGAA